MEADSDNSTTLSGCEQTYLADKTVELERHVAALDDADPSVRWMAIIRLGKIGDVPALAQALNNADSSVRWYAITSLAEIGDGATLIEALTHSDFRVQEIATRAVGQMDDVTAHLRALISASVRGSYAVKYMAEGRIIASVRKTGTRGVHALFPALADTDSLIRQGAAEILGKIGDDVAVPVLTQALADPDPTVRWCAVSALERIVDANALRYTVIAMSAISIEDRVSLFKRIVYGRPPISRFCNSLLKRDDIAEDVKIEARAVLAYLELVRHSAHSPATVPEDLPRTSSPTENAAVPGGLVSLLEGSPDTTPLPNSCERRTDGMVSFTSIQNCDDLIKNRCPRLWVNLQETDQEDVAFCTSCRKNVYFCYSREDAERHHDHCIALLESKPKEPTVHPIVRWFSMLPPVRKIIRWRRYMKALFNGNLG